MPPLAVAFYIVMIVATFLGGAAGFYKIAATLGAAEQAAAQNLEETKAVRADVKAFTEQLADHEVRIRVLEHKA